MQVNSRVTKMTGLETLIINLRDAGFPLILLWMLVLAVVYGILSHVSIPKSKATQGVISIIAAFLVFFAAASAQATTFLSNMVTSFIVVGIALLIGVIFMEMVGIKSGEHVFQKNAKFFAIILLVIVILIFIGAGGLSILNLPNISISETMVAVLIFLVVMVVAVWALMKGGKE